jgi:hypothetical protein
MYSTGVSHNDQVDTSSVLPFVQVSLEIIDSYYITMGKKSNQYLENTDVLEQLL